MPVVRFRVVAFHMSDKLNVFAFRGLMRTIVMTLRLLAAMAKVAFVSAAHT